MGEKICPICEESYPATTEHFYRYKKGLRTYCKKCDNKRANASRREKSAPEGCRTCQKFDRRSGKCAVMIELIEDCWAWTNDKNWQRKVKKAVAEYKKVQGTGYEDR